MRILSLLAVLILCASCSRSDSEQSSSPNNPRTSYGHTVKKTRDLQAPSEQEEETKRQAQELLDE